jgi:hypothetical protein
MPNPYHVPHDCCKTDGCPQWGTDRASDELIARLTDPTTLQQRIDALLATKPPVDPQTRVGYGTKVIRVEDLPTAQLRAQFGYGHFPAFRNEVVLRPDGVLWRYTPNMCLVADLGRGVWVDPSHLVCPGCGLDVT